jgi:hypothetical protein
VRLNSTPPTASNKKMLLLHRANALMTTRR